jgi:hypothetical protein
LDSFLTSLSGMFFRQVHVGSCVDRSNRKIHILSFET